MKSTVLMNMSEKGAGIVTRPIRLLIRFLGSAIQSRRVEADGYRESGELDFNELAASVAQCSPAMALDLIRQMDQYQALLQNFADLPAESY